MDDFSDTDFSALIETIARRLFSGKGYNQPEDWSSVDVKSVQAKCFVIGGENNDENVFSADVTILPVTSSAANVLQRKRRLSSHEETGTLDIECSVQFISAILEQFLLQENLRYFRYYLSIAIPLITLAIVFNSVAITAVTRVKQKYLRHHVLISVSISDVILTLALIFKRCSESDVIGILKSSSPPSPTWPPSPTAPVMVEDAVIGVVRNQVIGAWQTGYIMSALGLFCLSVDNVLAIAAPFFYEKLMVKPRWPKGFLFLLWLLVITTVILLHLLNMSDSFLVQMAVCVLMLILLVSILVSYIFTCTQAQLAQMRLAEQTGYAENQRRRSEVTGGGKRRKTLELLTRTRSFRGFLTIGLLVLCCLLCWSPLIGYLLKSEDTLASDHQFFSRYLCAALAVLHLNSVIDPVIYCLRMRDIRKSLFAILGIRQRRNNFVATNFVPRQSICSAKMELKPLEENEPYRHEVRTLEPIEEVSTSCSINNPLKSNNMNNGPEVENNNGDLLLPVARSMTLSMSGKLDETVIYNSNHSNVVSSNDSNSNRRNSFSIDQIVQI